MADNDIPQEYYGWWRIIETSQWANKHIDLIGTALISFTGCEDRLRMFALLAYVNCKPTKKGLSFTWEGAWEYDPVSGTGSVFLRKDGRLAGKIKIKGGDCVFRSIPATYSGTNRPPIPLHSGHPFRSIPATLKSYNL